MTVLDESEVRPSLVAHLDTGVLRQLGWGAETNAAANRDRGPRPSRARTTSWWLEVDTAAGRCIAVPLFSEPAPGSDPLDDALKGGLRAEMDRRTQSRRRA